MRHQAVAKKFGRSMAHRKELMSSLVANLILQDRITTTLPKAKQARRDAEKMVTLARKGTLASRRLAASRLRSFLPSRTCRDYYSRQYNYRLYLLQFHLQN